MGIVGHVCHRGDALVSRVEFVTGHSDLGVAQSMGAVATSADIAMTESFNATFTPEVLRDDRCFNDEADGRRHAFASLTRHNTERRHSRCGDLSPDADEEAVAPRRRRRPRTPPP